VGEIQFWVHPTVRNERNGLQVSVRRQVGGGVCVWRFAVCWTCACFRVCRRVSWPLLTVEGKPHERDGKREERRRTRRKRKRKRRRRGGAGDY
jgi:hypothetical protein